jgi:hypothetical protein
LVVTVVFVEVESCRTGSYVWTGALSKCRAQELLRPLKFAPNGLPQPPPNLAIEVCISELSGWNRFLIHKGSGAKKKKNRHYYEFVHSWVAVHLVSSPEMTAENFSKLLELNAELCVPV